MFLYFLGYIPINDDLAVDQTCTCMNILIHLRICAMYEANTPKIGNFFLVGTSVKVALYSFFFLSFMFKEDHL